MVGINSSHFFKMDDFASNSDSSFNFCLQLHCLGHVCHALISDLLWGCRVTSISKSHQASIFKKIEFDTLDL